MSETSHLSQPIEWPSILPKENSLRRPSMKWRFGSRLIVPTVGLLSKLWTDYLNHTTVHNHHVLLETLAKHYKNKAKKALITISNHSSCLDDPLMWGSLIPAKWHLNSHRLRWSAAAQEVCFSRDWHSTFFSFGKTFPIVRGKGIYQPAMDYALALLRDGHWLHFFPQGKVMVNKEDESRRPYELKWGLARLILDHAGGGDNELDVLPIYHVGMDDVLPNARPYVPRVNKKVTFYVRADGPIRVDRNFLASLVQDFSGLSASAKRVKIMQFFEREFDALREKANNAHLNVQTLIS